MAACVLVAEFKGVKMHEDSKSQSIERKDSYPSFKGDSKTFSGEVRVSLFFDRKEWRNFGGALVEFGPNARSAWHTHPGGQTLMVTEGEIITQVQGERANVAQKGEVISCPPGLKHWHGARGSRAAHIALTGYKEDKNVEWLELVSDEEYEKALKEAE